MECSRLEEYSIANIAVGLTLSGIDPNEIPAWDYDRSGLVGFYEYWTEEVWQVLCDTAEDAQVANQIISEVRAYEHVGDFQTDDYEGQRKIYAAFVLISLERLAQCAINEQDGWRAMWHLQAVLECMRYVDPQLKTARRNAINAARSKNLDERSRIIGKWKSDGTQYKNKTDFSNHWSNELKKGGTNVSSRTIAERWLKNM